MHPNGYAHELQLDRQPALLRPRRLGNTVDLVAWRGLIEDRSPYPGRPSIADSVVMTVSATCRAALRSWGDGPYGHDVVVENFERGVELEVTLPGSAPPTGPSRE
jgi:hypothetical protein